MTAPLFADVRAIFFDLDDTLCQYWEAARAGLFRAFEAHPVSGYTTEQMVEVWARTFRAFLKEVHHPEWYGRYLKTGEVTRTEQMRRTLEAVGIEDARHSAALSQAYMEQRDRLLKLFDDTEEVLSLLRPRYPLGLITNGPADIQRQEIDTLGIGHYFDAILIEGEMGEGKPKPSVFRRAEDGVGKAASHILFVGNSYAHDIRPAIEAGWRTAWIRRPTDVPPSAGPGGSAVEMKPPEGPEPDVQIGNLRELLPHLGI